MSTFEGTIACINNKYVILNDKRHLIEKKFLHELLPDDIVNYEVTSENKINIIKLKQRNTQVLFGIIKNIVDEYAELFCYGLPKFFSPKIKLKKEYQIGSVIIFKINLSTIEPMYFYDNITNRRNDINMMIDLYEINADFTHIRPIYNFDGESCYTEETKDLTHLDTFNVDPVNSKDFDDAISIDPSNNKIYIHIVDANTQIKPNSYEDISAFKHAFTLYLAEYNQNMLPSYLAEQELSLVKGHERKTITVEFDIDHITQKVLKYDIYKAIIKVKNRYNYQDYEPILKKSEFLVNFYEKWKKSTLNIPHLKLDINENGELYNYSLEENADDSHKMIETLMILTNLTISKHVKIPQRYHSKVEGQIELIDYTGNPIIDAILTIKKYRPAAYDAENNGHFGLGLDTYTHFTSPIRRYFDIIIHRLLGGTRYNNLEQILDHINKRERQIDKWVKLYDQLKIMGFLEKHMNNQWNAYVLNKTTSGVVVFLEDLLFEIFIFNIDNYYCLGDKVLIQIKKVDWLTLTVRAVFI